MFEGVEALGAKPKPESVTACKCWDGGFGVYGLGPWGRIRELGLMTLGPEEPGW